MDKRKNVLIAAACDECGREDITDVLVCRDNVAEAIRSVGLQPCHLDVSPEDFENTDALTKRIYGYGPLCVFNLFEGFAYDVFKEAEFAFILSGIDVPFTGNGHDAIRMCADKQRVKDVLRERGLNVPYGVVITATGKIPALDIRFPVFVKPRFQDGSVGIDGDSLVYTQEDLIKSCSEKLKSFNEGLIVEEFICGQEYLVGLTGRYPYGVLGVSSIDYAKCDCVFPFLNYSSKWDKASKQYKNLAPVLGAVSDEHRTVIERTAISAGEALGCRGYFRVDIREKGGRMYVLDVNPNPDINRDSGFVKQAAFSGFSYEEIIKCIVREAVDGGYS